MASINNINWYCHATNSNSKYPEAIKNYYNLLSSQLINNITDMPVIDYWYDYIKPQKLIEINFKRKQFQK